MNPYSFDACFEFLYWVEGIYSNNEADTGGETKYGISHTAYPQEDIKNLTKERAEFLYKRDYWTTVGADYMAGKLAAYMFDSAVNCGVSRANKWLQQSLVVLGHELKLDGVIGKHTLLAVSKHPVEVLIEMVGTYRRRHYYEIIKKNATQTIFGKGWMERANKIGLFCAGMPLRDIQKFYGEY